MLNGYVERLLLSIATERDRMPTTRNIFRIYLNLFGPRHLTTTENISQLLDALESDARFQPEFIGNDERNLQQYDREWILNEFEQNTDRLTFFIRRKKAAKFFGYFRVYPRPFFYIDFHTSLARKNYSSLIDWSNALISVFQPDYGSLLFLPEYKEDPWPTQLDKDLNRFFGAGWQSEGGYYKTGPTGVAMYTWLSDYIVNHIGKPYLEETPNLNIERRDWGGYFLTLDLPSAPWEVPTQDLIDVWKPAMQHLWKTGVFVEQYEEDGKLRFRPGSKQLAPRTS